MSDSALAVWSVFISGVLAAVILLIGFVVAVVLSQRRYLNLHRSHARRILEAQEEERAWVSREVHDDAVQRLALIGQECGALTASEPPISDRHANQLRAIQAELQDLGVFLRGLAHRLHPALIDRGGLRAAVAGLCEEMERGYGLRVETRLPRPEEAISGSQGTLMLYRIAQEALQNIVRHAGVTSAIVELSTSPDGVELVVRDSGRGFDPKSNHRTGIGLMGMTERAYLAGGQVVITSALGEGTVVRATLPVQREAGE